MENDTQVCDLSWNRTQEFDDDKEKENSPVAVFTINNQKLLIYPGKQYVIGRGAGVSLQVLVKTLSKKHIQIEHEGGSHLITDLGSRNKTKRGELLLRPNVVYELPDKTDLLLGDTKASYNYIHENKESVVDNILEVTTGRVPNCSSTPAKTVRIQDEVQALEISADGDSSDVEAVPASQFLPNLDESSLLYVEDSPQNSPAKNNSGLGQQVPETPAANRTTGRKLQLDESEDLGQDTSLANRIKELDTLAKLQRRDSATTIPDSQQPDLTTHSITTSVPNSQQPDMTSQNATTSIPDSQKPDLALDPDEESECGSEIMDLNNEGEETKAEELAANESEVEEEDAMNMDDLNTQCWDITIPPEEDEEEETVQENTEKSEKQDGDKTEKTEEQQDCDTTGDTATASESEDEPAQVVETSSKAPVKIPVNESDMEITCVEKSSAEPADKTGGEISMLSEGLSGGFSPTSAPITENDDGDSDATELDDLPTIPERLGPLPSSNRRSTRTLTPEPPESVIEPPVMSESELENSVDRRDKYRRSLMNSMAEDSQMWASVMSMKTSSTGSNCNSQEDPEKTPPHEDFVEDIARTPPRPEKSNSNPVTTPTKILEVKSQIEMVNISEGDIEGDFVETQEIPNISMIDEDLEAETENIKKDLNDQTSDAEKLAKKSASVAESDSHGKAPTVSPEANKKADEDKQERLSLEEEHVLHLDEDDDKSTVGDDKSTVGDDKSTVGDEVPTVSADDGSDTEPEDNVGKETEGEHRKPAEVDDDELQITSIEDPCSLVITHVKDVEEGNEVEAIAAPDQDVRLDSATADTVGVDAAGADDVGEVEDKTGDKGSAGVTDTADVRDEETTDDGDGQIPDADEDDGPCTLDLDVKLIGGTDDFDVKVKGEPNSQDQAGKSFMSMFDSEGEDGPVYDSQLNTLPAEDHVIQSYDLISPVKKKELPSNLSKGGKSRVTKPRAAPGRRKKKPLPSESEEEVEGDVLKKETKRNSKDKLAANVREAESPEKNESKEAKVDGGRRQTVLKLDSVEELLRKRREVKKKLDEKESSKASKTRAKGRKAIPKKVLDDDDDLPEFGLLEDGSEEDSDEVIELDLITSCSKPKIVPVQLPPVVKQEPKPKLQSKNEFTDKDDLLGGSRKRKPVSSQPQNTKKDKKSPPAAHVKITDEKIPSPPASPKLTTGARKQKRVLSDSDDDSTRFFKKREKVSINDESDDTQSSIASSRSIRSRNTGRTITAGKSKRGSSNKIFTETESDDGTSVEKTDEVPRTPTETKKTAPTKRARKKKNVTPEPSEEEEEEDEHYPVPTPAPSTPVGRRGRGRATKSSAPPVKKEPSPAPIPRRRTTPSGSVEGSPAPVSKRGRRRKVNSDVKEFLQEAKKELETKTGRGTRGTKVKEEVVEEEEKGNVAMKTEPRRRGGRASRKSEVKQEVEASPEPLITVGRGKRKKTSSIKEEAQSPSAAIVNKTYKQEQSTPRRATISRRVEIVYTGITADNIAKRNIAALDGIISSDINSCTHLVTDKIKRTSKFLCAIGRGIPIVSENWLKESKKSKFFLDTTDFVIKDKETEKKYKFVLIKSLTTARNSPFLTGWTVHVTKSCEPTPDQFEPIINCNGGTMIRRAPKASDSNLIVIATPDDKLTTLKKSGAPICTPELVLTGALRQELCISEFSLREKSPDF